MLNLGSGTSARRTSTAAIVAAGDPSGARALSERARHMYESSASPFATPSQTGATPVAMADLGE